MEIEVVDGLLEIALVPSVDNPKISAIEIRFDSANPLTSFRAIQGVEGVLANYDVLWD